MAAATKQSTKRPARVHISAQSHRHLREMAAQEGERMCVVLEKALEQYRRQKFWGEMRAAYAVIQSDPEAMAAEKKEFALWEVTLMDGLDPNETWADDGAVHSDGAACLTEEKFA